MVLFIFWQREDILDAVEGLTQEVLNKECKINVEYKTTLDHVSLQIGESNEDVGLMLVTEGLVLVDQRRERHLATMMAKFNKAQAKAKDARVSREGNHGIYIQAKVKEISLNNFAQLQLSLSFPGEFVAIRGLHPR